MREYWFPTPFYYNDGINVDGYYDKLKALQSNNDIVKSNKGGWHSEDLLNNDEFKPLVEIIEEQSNEVWVDFHPNKNGKFKINSIWAIINKPGDYNASHIHPGGVISGSIYIKSDDDSGSIQFDDPNMEKKMFESLYTDNDGFHTYRTVEYKPKNGRLLFFPSYIRHSVDENKSKEDRAVIAFNMVSEFD
jgi:uncharacterized protein (TIGR02466 family)